MKGVCVFLDHIYQHLKRNQFIDAVFPQYLEEFQGQIGKKSSLQYLLEIAKFGTIKSHVIIYHSYFFVV